MNALLETVHSPRRNTCQFTVLRAQNYARTRFLAANDSVSKDSRINSRIEITTDHDRVPHCEHNALHSSSTVLQREESNVNRVG